MAALELFHRIYTHAPSEFRAAGGRFERVARDAADVLPKPALKELDDLLAKLEPEGDAPAYAMRRFESFAASIVAVRGVDDALGRNGTRKHARIVRIDRDEPWLDPLPLTGEVSVDDDTLDVPSLSASSFERLSRRTLHDMLVVALATLGRRDAVRVQTREPLERLALAAASLPAGLQRQYAWAVNAAEGAPVDVIWSSSGKPPSSLATGGVEQTVSSYLELLLDSHFDLGPLMSDDGIREATDLQKFVRKAAIAKPPGSKRNMPKRTTNHDSDEPELLAKLDRQQQAIYRSLRQYIDKRLAAHDAARQESASSAPQLPLAAIAATAALTALLVLGGQWLWTKFRAPNRAPFVETEQPRIDETNSGEQPETPATPQPSAQRRAVSALIAAAETNGQWAEALKTLSEQQAAVLAGFVDGVAKAQDVSGGVQRQLTAYAARLRGSGKPLDADARGALRPLLFEYVVKSVADDQSVDGKLDEIDAALLQRAKNQWRVQSVATKADDRELQSELILRYLEDRLQ